jgi:hypothetical protein
MDSLRLREPVPSQYTRRVKARAGKNSLFRLSFSSVFVLIAVSSSRIIKLIIGHAHISCSCGAGIFTECTGSADVCFHCTCGCLLYPINKRDYACFSTSQLLDKASHDKMYSGSARGRLYKGTPEVCPALLFSISKVCQRR